LLLFFAGILPGRYYNFRVPPSFYNYPILYGFYNGIATATVGFAALIFGPIAGLIAGFIETIFNLIFIVGFYDYRTPWDRYYVGSEYIQRVFNRAFYFFFMYAIFGFVAGLCFRFTKLKNIIKIKNIVVMNTIAVVFNILINRIVTSAVCGLIVIPRYRSLYSGIRYRVLTQQPISFLITECLTMIVFLTLFTLYYKKAKEDKGELIRESLNETK
jgi:uncharacterized membrane protein